ncbi:: HK97-gp10_like [Gemmata massiliana]|uniref:: HK97-gp10_like n=1 Tax=Gemmata massiliana TaxID=1210884 RepID=A0A6P2D731_9BACT|nr:HK97 gp10 family phage protein [Gemmata massiliana]VTR95240.1 : HK97-gp10_like [Gemmata massiliana]
MIGARTELDLTPIDGLNQSGIRRATRIGLNRAASPVKASVEAHATAVKRFGYLAKSIRIRLRLYPADRFVAVVGPASKFTRTKGVYKRGKRKGEKRLFKPSKYAHLVERGTRHSKAKPWLKPAHDATAARFLQVAGYEVGAELEHQLFRTFKVKK